MSKKSTDEGRIEYTVHGPSDEKRLFEATVNITGDKASIKYTLWEDLDAEDAAEVMRFVRDVRNRAKQQRKFEAYSYGSKRVASTIGEEEENK